MTDTKTYTCALCHDRFSFVLDGTWSEEQAKEEYERHFPASKWEDRKIVCDDCWKRIKPSKP